MPSRTFSPTQVTVVIVTYNSAAVIAECLKAIQGCQQVIIVDNASADGTVELARNIVPGVHVIENKKNMGLGFAVNQGFAQVKTDYALYLNPDAVLDENALMHLLDEAQQNLNAAMITPLLVSPENSQPELYLKGPLEDRHFREENRPAGSFCTWFSTGAVFLYRMQAWKILGGFDERIFLFSEDFDLCLRTTKAGFAIVVAPRAIAYHLSGQSVPATPKIRTLKDWHMAWSHFYILAKYGNQKRARKEASHMLRKHGLKALLYILLLRPDKVRGNYAKAHAAYAFLLGKPSSVGPGG